MFRRAAFLNSLLFLVAGNNSPGQLILGHNFSVPSGFVLLTALDLFGSPWRLLVRRSELLHTIFTWYFKFITIVFFANILLHFGQVPVDVLNFH